MDLLVVIAIIGILSSVIGILSSVVLEITKGAKCKESGSNCDTQEVDISNYRN